MILIYFYTILHLSGILRYSFSTLCIRHKSSLTPPLFYMYQTRRANDNIYVLVVSNFTSLSKILKLFWWCCILFLFTSNYKP